MVASCPSSPSRLLEYPSPSGSSLGPRVEVAKLVLFEPVHHPVSIRVLGAGDIVGNELVSAVIIAAYLAARHPVGRCLAHPIDRPVSKVGTIGRPV